MIYFSFVKRNIRRAPYQALAACMVMLFTFLCLSLFLAVGFASEQALKYYESRPQTIAFFKDGTTENDVNAIKNALEQTGKITSLKYISKEEALNIYKETNKDKPILVQLVTANTLPSSLEISTVSPKDLEPISEVLKKEPVVEEVVYPKDVIQALSKTAQVVRWVGLALMSFLIVFSILVILMIIGFKIRLRRSEIETMKLLGASPWFIKSPFLLEGMFYGVVGAVYAWIITLVLIWYFSPWIERYLRELHLIPVSPIYMGELLLIEIAVGIIIGGVGSYAASRRYLRL